MKHLRYFENIEEKDNVFYLPESAKKDIELCFASVTDIVSLHRIDGGWVDLDPQKANDESGRFDYNEYSNPGNFSNVKYYEAFKIILCHKQVYDEITIEKDGDYFCGDIRYMDKISKLINECSEAITKLKNIHNYNVCYTIDQASVQIIIYANETP